MAERGADAALGVDLAQHRENDDGDNHPCDQPPQAPLALAAEDDRRLQFEQLRGGEDEHGG